LQESTTTPISSVYLHAL